MKSSHLIVLLCSASSMACPGEGPTPDTTDASVNTDAAPDASTAADVAADTAVANVSDASDASDAPDVPDLGDADFAPEVEDPPPTTRQSICGDVAWAFDASAVGEPEVVAERGSLDGSSRDFSFLEGPVWRDGVLHFSDFNNSSPLAQDDQGPPTIVWRLDPDGSVTNTWPEGSVRSNGIALGEDGMFYVSDHAARGITRVSQDGTREVLVDAFMGQALNATNDLVLTSDGSIFFTDPTYGSQVDGRPTPLGYEGVFRRDPSGMLHLVDDTYVRPNGITVSPDERTLYVASKNEDKVFAYPLVDGVPGARRVFVDGQSVDGMAVDCAGNVFLTVPGEALRAFDPSGRMIWEALPGRSLTNAAFGGPNRDVLYVTEARRLHRIQMTVPGMPY